MNGINESWYTSNTQEWATPQKVFDELDAEFHFTLDPCCTHENAKCEKHYTIEDDGLSKSWAGEIVFCNPPYRDMSKWARKCYEESLNGTPVVMLVPARTDTRWFHDYIYHKAEIIPKIEHLNEEDGVLKFIKGDEDSLSTLITLLGISGERFKRIVSMIRSDYGHIFETEWDYKTNMRSKLLENPRILADVCELFQYGYVSPKFTSRIPHLILQKFRIDESLHGGNL